jgi:polyferredoxin
MLSDGSIRNGYTVKLLNKVAEPRAVRLSLDGLDGATMTITGIDLPDTREVFMVLEPDRLRNLRVFVRVPADRVVPGASNFTFTVAERQGPETASYSAIFHAPEPD